MLADASLTSDHTPRFEVTVQGGQITCVKRDGSSFYLRGTFPAAFKGDSYRQLDICDQQGAPINVNGNGFWPSWHAHQMPVLDQKALGSFAALKEAAPHLNLDACLATLAAKNLPVARDDVDFEDANNPSYYFGDI